MAEKVCPVWIGYLLASPIRKLFQNPKTLLLPYIKEGMRVLDIGCAMGFFSLPLAQMVGPEGKVICVDVQDKMIETLEKRAGKAGLFDRIETRLCKTNSLGLDDLQGQFDFALASAVVHEVPDVSNFFAQLYKTIKPNGILLVAEPKKHVSKEDFAETILIACRNGFEVTDNSRVIHSHVVLLVKKE